MSLNGQCRQRVETRQYSPEKIRYRLVINTPCKLAWISAARAPLVAIAA